MIDAILNDPEKVGIISLLLVAVVALVRGTVLPGSTHDKIVTGVRDQYDAKFTELKEQYEANIATIRESEALWRQIALRGVQLSETASRTSLELVAKQRPTLEG